MNSIPIVASEKEKIQNYCGYFNLLMNKLKLNINITTDQTFS